MAKLHEQLALGAYLTPKKASSAWSHVRSDVEVLKKGCGVVADETPTPTFRGQQYSVKFPHTLNSSSPP